MDAAEKIQKEKHRAKNLPSYNSQEVGDLNQLDVIREYEEKLKEFQDDLQQVLDGHKQNSLKWAQFQLDQQSMPVNTEELKESVKS